MAAECTDVAEWRSTKFDQQHSTEGNFRYSAGRPSLWSSAHILLILASAFVTAANDVMFSSLFVCLSVCLSNFAQNLPNGFALNFQGRLAMGQ